MKPDKHLAALQRQIADLEAQEAAARAEYESITAEQAALAAGEAASGIRTRTVAPGQLSEAQRLEHRRVHLERVLHVLTRDISDARLKLIPTAESSFMLSRPMRDLSARFDDCMVELEYILRTERDLRARAAADGIPVRLQPALSHPAIDANILLAERRRTAA